MYILSGAPKFSISCYGAYVDQVESCMEHTSETMTYTNQIFQAIRAGRRSQLIIPL